MERPQAAWRTSKTMNGGNATPTGHSLQEMLSNNDASSIYRERLSQRYELLTALLSRVVTVVFMRGATGLMIPGILWQAFTFHFASAWLVILPAMLFVLFHRYYEKVHREMNAARRGITFYERGLQRLEDRWAGEGITHTHFA